MEEQEQDMSLESFLKWAADLGISDSAGTVPYTCLGHSLSLSYFPHAGGRGLGAVRDLRKGELILRVPKSALMTRESLLKDHKLSLAVNKHPSLSSIQILTVCLLYEMGKGKSSWWYPYLMHLPRGYDILATFGEFEKQAFQVADAIWAAEKAILKAKLEWKEANQLMEELKLKPQLLTFRAWLWAASTISSRTLHIPWDEAGCLCAVGDLFNYAAPGEETVCSEEVDSWMSAPSFQVSSLSNGDCTQTLSMEQFDAHDQRLTDGGYQEDVAAYCFYARQNYTKGEQVLLCYGTYTNLELLEHYGFLLNENSNDKVFIPLEPEIYSSSSWPKESLHIHQNGRPSFSLLSALRLWATPSNKRRSVGHLAYSGSQLSTDNEVHVMKWISKKCNAILKNLPTSIEEDSLLLSSFDEIQDLHTILELEKVLSASREIWAFLEANNLQNVDSDSNLLLSRKIRRSIDRWKLAIQWRLRYKKILLECISYCTEIKDSLLRNI
ncbi:protein SET DOMAIN GROUP 40 isoform X1 [Alnus glutinosa]|uniref:protein SET DOMAIN GROUP 40 isoform X1 n=2 Tax=Alnus glutinosa TaxID=3517 RepID=UPI002D78B3EA|nr:protein SET DOMAIN GROUP 40 isoform X1 [Alnus glutinosa]